MSTWRKLDCSIFGLFGHNGRLLAKIKEVVLIDKGYWCRTRQVWHPHYHRIMKNRHNAKCLDNGSLGWWTAYLKPTHKIWIDLDYPSFEGQKRDDLYFGKIQNDRFQWNYVLSSIINKLRTMIYVKNALLTNF